MLYWPFCLGCFSTRHLLPVTGLRCSQLCLVCREELDSLRCAPGQAPHASPPLLDITGLFSYQGLVRQLILRAKVGGDLQALRLLLALIHTHPVGQSLFQWADTLMPCASSLWGRVRGRIDIAGQIAARCQRPACPVTAAPVHLQWRWRKQALRRRSQRRVDSELPGWLVRLGRERCAKTLTRHNTQHLLLIDDVVTSGSTLRHTAAQLAPPRGDQPNPPWPLPLIRGFVFAVS